MDENNNYGCPSINYEIICPEEASLLDLFRMLFSSTFEKMKFIHCPAEEKRIGSGGPKKISFWHRWLIVISVLAQKMLMHFSKPMALMGLLIQMCQNFLSNNPGPLVFIIHLIQGNMIPDRDSYVGPIDKRMKLDRTNKPGEEWKYYSKLCMMASKLAYENKAFIRTIVEDHWKMEYLGVFDCWNDYQKKATTQLFIFRNRRSDDDDTIVVAFRGTEVFCAYDWCTDLDLSWCQLGDMGRVHFGFIKALGLPKTGEWPVECEEESDLAYCLVRDKLYKLLSESTKKTKYVVTGHSLGGALAGLFPAILAFHKNKYKLSDDKNKYKLLLERLEGVYTYGQPRVGDKEFGKHMKAKLETHKIPYYRFVYGNDIVPRLPYDDNDLMFKHFGTCLHYNWNYHGKVVLDIPNKNYFSALHVVPMRIQAILELARSFTICYSKGQEYKEGWVFVFCRMIGILVMPGLSAHSSHEYINSTRLGSSDLSLPIRDLDT